MEHDRNMDSMTWREWIEALASKEPVPGGGGASALVGAIGVALGSMVAELTKGKAKYAGVQADMVALERQADDLRGRLLALAEEDARVFAPLAKAYAMPGKTEAEQEEKAQVMAVALRKCCEVPLEIMHCCCVAIEMQEQFAAKGATIAISDVGCGVICCKAALQAASLNVFINTKAMWDRTAAEQYNQEADELLECCLQKADDIFDGVAQRLR